MRDDPERGSFYGRWFAALTGESWYAGDDVAYCAMATSYWLTVSGVGAAGIPGAYCPWILEAGYTSGEGVDWRGGYLQPGDIVLFDWQPDGVADHVGLVEYNRGDVIQTIEGNTSSGGKAGVVARKTRALSTICGAIRPRYDATPAPAPSRLDEDGWIGRATIWAWGEQLHCDHTDALRDQRRINQRCWPRIISLSGLDCGDGDWLVHAIQRKVGTGQDGHLGPITVKGIQRFVGVSQDGIIGPATARAIQRSINEGRWG